MNASPTARIPAALGSLSEHLDRREMHAKLLVQLELPGRTRLVGAQQLRAQFIVETRAKHDPVHVIREGFAHFFNAHTQCMLLPSMGSSK